MSETANRSGYYKNDRTPRFIDQYELVQRRLRNIEMSEEMLYTAIFGSKDSDSFKAYNQQFNSFISYISGPAGPHVCGCHAADLPLDPLRDRQCRHRDRSGRDRGREEPSLRSHRPERRRPPPRHHLRRVLRLPRA